MTAELDASLQGEIEAAHRTLYVDFRAREALAASVALPDPRPQPDAGYLSEFLGREQEETWRIDQLLPSSGRMLLTAQRKLGKTTLTGNLSRSLLTGEPFLGRFDVRRLDGCVVALNYEVTPQQYGRWMADLGVPADRLYVINMRGRRNLLADAEGREGLAELIRKHEGEALIVDPFGRAYTGRSQNDAAEITLWLGDLDRVAEASGAQELIVTAHAGWGSPDRTRGSSGIEDWPDVIVTMTSQSFNEPRFLKAEGRDVNIPEDRLDYDPETRRLSLAGAGSRSELREADVIEGLAARVAVAVAEEPGINIAGLEAAVGAPRSGQIGKAAKRAVELGLVRQESGPRNSKIHLPTGVSPDAPALLRAAP